MGWRKCNFRMSPDAGAKQPAPLVQASWTIGPEGQRPQTAHLRSSLRGVAGDLLLAYPLPLRTSCWLGDAGARSHLFGSGSGAVPEGVESISFVHDGAVVHQLKSAMRRRELKSSQPLLALVSGSSTSRGAPLHPNSQPTPFFCRYSNDGGQTWFRLAGARPTHSRRSISIPFPGAMLASLQWSQRTA